jgi:hypothetical protein
MKMNRPPSEAAFCGHYVMHFFIVCALLCYNTKHTLCLHNVLDRIVVWFGVRSRFIFVARLHPFASRYSLAQSGRCTEVGQVQQGQAELVQGPRRRSARPAEQAGYARIKFTFMFCYCLCICFVVSLNVDLILKNQLNLAQLWLLRIL